MRWTSALSRDPDTASAVSEVVSTARATLGRPADLVVLFASPHHQPRYEALVHAVASSFPGAVVIGGSGGGVIGGGREVEGPPALALTAAWLPGVDIQPFHLDTRAVPVRTAGRAPWARALGLPPDSEPAFLLVADPFTTRTEGFLAGLDAAWPKAAKVGGLASGGRNPGTTALFLGDEVHHSGTVGIALTGNLVVDTLVAQGCKPIGPPMIVTRSEGNLILELDGRSPVAALQELYAHLDEHDRKLFQAALFCGVEMRDTVEHQEGEFLVRNVLGLHEDNEGLYIGEALKPWQVVRFHVRDAQTSDGDLRRRLERYRDAHPGVPSGALLFQCLGRGEGLYGHPDHDSDVFHELLGDVPVGGFFCNGEIGPVNGHTFLHGYTSAFGLFRPRATEA